MGNCNCKRTEDRLYTQEDSDNGYGGSPMPDGKSVGDVKVLVETWFKTIKIEDIKQQASNLLSPTDWYVIKATEEWNGSSWQKQTIYSGDYNVPSNVTTFRTDVSAKSNEMEFLSNSASDVDALQALFTYTQQDDNTITRPLGEFPRLEN